MPSLPAVVRNALLLATLGGAVGGLYTVWLPTVYRASAVVVVPPETGAGMGGGVMGLGGGSQTDFILGYATSLPVMQGAVKRAGQVWKESSDGMAAAKNEDFSQITLSSDQRDSAKALRLCQAWLEQLRKTYTETAFTGSRRLSTYVGETLHRREGELEKGEGEMADMLAAMKTAPSGDGAALNIEYEQRLRRSEAELATATATVKAARSIGDRAASLSGGLVPTADKTLEEKRKCLTDAEVQLRILLTTQGDQAPDVNRQREVVRVLREELRDEAARYVKGLQSGVSLAVAAAETDRLVKEQEVASLRELVRYARTESLAFARKQRDVMALRGTVASLRTQYETSLVEEQVDRSKWEVLTPPYLEPKPVNKGYLRNSLAGALLLAVLYLGIWYGKDQFSRES